MQLDFQIGKKKDVYPSKKSINLYYQVDDTTKWSTLALDILFVVVLVAGLAKFLVIDVLVERNEALTKLENAQIQLEQYTGALEEFEKVSEEYARYSYEILVEDLGLHDRVEILEMLEATVFQYSEISGISVVDNVISLNLTGMNLNETALLIEKIQQYEIVESVQINNQNASDGIYNGNMTIILYSLKAEEVVGGEQ